MGTKFTKLENAEKYGIPIPPSGGSTSPTNLQDSEINTSQNEDSMSELGPSPEMIACFENDEIRRVILGHVLRNGKDKISARDFRNFRQVSWGIRLSIDEYLMEAKNSPLNVTLSESETETEWINSWIRRTVMDVCNNFLGTVRSRRSLMGDAPFPFRITIDPSGNTSCRMMEMISRSCPNEVIGFRIIETFNDSNIIVPDDSTFYTNPNVKSIELIPARQGGSIYKPNLETWIQRIMDRCISIRKFALTKPPQSIRISNLRYSPTLEELETIYCPPNSFGDLQARLQRLKSLKLYSTNVMSPQTDVIQILRNSSRTMKKFAFVVCSSDHHGITRIPLKDMPAMRHLRCLTFNVSRTDWNDRLADKQFARKFPELKTIKMSSRSGGMEAFGDGFMQDGSFPSTSIRALDIRVHEVEFRGSFPVIAVKKIKYLFPSLRSLYLKIRARHSNIVHTIFAKLIGLEELTFDFIDSPQDGGNDGVTLEFESLIIGTRPRYLTELRDKPDMWPEFIADAFKYPVSVCATLTASIRELKSLKKFSLRGLVFGRRSRNGTDEIFPAMHLITLLSFELAFKYVPSLLELTFNGSFEIPLRLLLAWRSRYPLIKIQNV